MQAPDTTSLAPHAPPEPTLADRVGGLVLPAVPLLLLLLLVAFTALLVKPRRFARRDADAALRALLRHVQGDRTIATRLARFELERAPHLSDAQAIERALARLERARR